MQTVERAKLTVFVVGVALLAYGIRANSEAARLAAIIVLIAGLALRWLKTRKPDDA